MPANAAPEQVDYLKIPIKTPAQVAMLRAAGHCAAQILEDLTPHIKPGVTKHELNDIAYKLIHDKYGCEVDREDLTGYDSSPYACVSFSHNEIAFNGEADSIPLKHGDLFGIDISIKKEGWCGDCARNWIIGEDTSSEARLLSAVAYQAMCLGISLVKPGRKVQEMAERVQRYVESFGFSMLRVPSGTGHSIGLHHADGWHIPYYHDGINEGRVLEKGMVFSVEPFICTGKPKGLRFPNVTKTAISEDKSLCCYWEHIVAVVDDGCEILDLRQGEDTTFFGREPEH
ncbi:MAG: hypothetical protein Q9165_005194 [Trypethelium subeluteriae]